MEDHLDGLVSKLINSKNSQRQTFVGVCWSTHELNPLLISFNEMNSLRIIQSQKESVMSIEDFIKYVQERRLVEKKNIGRIANKYEDLKQLLDNFEQAIAECVKKFKKNVLDNVVLDFPCLHFCSYYLENFCNGNYKSDEDLVMNTKKLLRNLIGSSVIDLNKFDEKIDKDTGIDHQIKKVKFELEQTKNWICVNSNFLLRPFIKYKTAGIQCKGVSGAYNSRIVKWSEHEMISQWIEGATGEPKTFEELFNSEDHGFASKDFHRICNNKGSTITFIETTDGKRFGGYANSSWQSDGEYIDDKKCFIFSLDLKEQYFQNPTNPKSLYGYSSYGPTFGNGYDIYLCNNCDINAGSYCQPNTSYNCYLRTNIDIAGSLYFKVKRYEVYLVKQQKKFESAKKKLKHINFTLKSLYVLAFALIMQ